MFPHRRCCAAGLDLIPLVMVYAVLEERLTRRDEAIKEMTATWGNPLPMPPLGG